jgi:hypothetical protein
LTTGIGGLFYLLSAIIILISELYVTLQGKSSKKRWEIILEQSWIAFSMIAIAIITNFVLSTYIKKTSVLYPLLK